MLAAGGRADRVIFSGVGKGESEMRDALAAGIRCFNVESEPELERLDAIAASMGKRAPVSLRINPDVDAKTHPYISTGMAGNKFGIPHARALEAYRRAGSLPHLEVTGIGCHIGSQILESGPLDEALERVLELASELEGEGITLTHLDLGGGFGIRYRDESPLDVRGYCAKLAARLAGCGMQVMLEPGRAIVGPAGALVTRVEYLKLDKAKRFAVVDASMSELIRPALYEAYHEIVAGCLPRRRRARVRHRGAGVRIGRRARLRPQARGAGGRSPRDPFHRRLRNGDGVELQLPPAPAGGSGGCRSRAARARKGGARVAFLDGKAPHGRVREVAV